MHPRKPRQGNLVAGGGWAGHGPIGLSAAVSLSVFGVRVRSVQFGFFRARSVSEAARASCRTERVSQWLPCSPCDTISSFLCYWFDDKGWSRASYYTKLTLSDGERYTSRYCAKSFFLLVILRGRGEIERAQSRAELSWISEYTQWSKWDRSCLLFFVILHAPWRIRETFVELFAYGTKKETWKSVDQGRVQVRSHEIAVTLYHVISRYLADNGSVAWRGVMDNKRTLRVAVRPTDRENSMWYTRVSFARNRSFELFNKLLRTD